MVHYRRNLSSASFAILALLFATSRAQTNATNIPANYTVASKYLPDLGMLFVDTLDQYGTIIERTEKYFALPPTSVCSMISYGTFLSSLEQQNIAPLGGGSNLASESQIQCCDMYSEGEGYQFTICNSGVGSYILTDRLGSSTDLMYRNMPENEVGFNNVTWDLIVSAVDSYCIQ